MPDNSQPDRPESRDYPPPLDLTTTPEGGPFLVRTGPGFQWYDGRLMVMWAVPGGPVLWKALEAEESRRLLEWMLKSVEAIG